ncbi:MAG: GntR family transcriptional regulator [Bacillota bacterium]|nr:GntR family transcriptional regulator [Bacillota bacterium]
MIIIDSRSSTPIYQQIVDGIKENILKGIIQPGDRLPSVREMSSMITANPNTVSRAYSELERQKVIETIRGKGTYVTSNYKPKVEEERMEILKEDIKKIVVEAHYMGLKKDDLVKLMDEIFNNLDGTQLTSTNNIEKK